MELENQNLIVRQLMNQGLSDEEIMRRLEVAKLSNSGAYDIYTDTYTDMENNEPSAASDVPHLVDNNHQDYVPLAPLPELPYDENGEPIEPSNLPRLSSYEELAQEHEELHGIPLPTDKDVRPKTPDSLKDEECGEDFLKKNHLPYESWGGVAKRIIKEYSEAFKVNPDMIAAMILVICGAAANRKTILRTFNYSNSPSLWVAIVERTGGGKSEPQSRLERPLIDVNRDLVLQYKKVYAEWAAAGSKGTPPTRQKVVVDDTTPEILYQLLVAQGLYLSREELSGLFKDFGRYNTSGEVERFLSIFSGKSFSVDRVNAASFEVENPFLSILGGIQPRVMQESFGGKNYEASGFLARWLFVVMPDSKVPDCVSETIISRDIENEWYSLIVGLWKMDKREFRLSDEAAQAYQGFMKATAKVMNHPDCDEDIRGMYAKLRIYVLRIALVIHILKDGAKAADMIDRKTMDSAVRTCEVFAYWNTQALSLIRGTQTKKTISNADLLREFAERYHVSNQSELARLIGKSQQYVSRVLSDKPIIDINETK